MTATDERPPWEGEAEDMPVRWRRKLRIHPACDIWPRLNPTQLRELGEDIWRHGLRLPIVVQPAAAGDPDRRPWLIDGRERLTAMDSVGLLADLEIDHNRLTLTLPGHDVGEILWPEIVVLGPQVDAIDYVMSVNAHRRHLSTEQRMEATRRLTAMQPDRSARVIARQAGVSPTTAARVRNEMEAAGEVPRTETRTDARGHRRAAGTEAPQLSSVDSSPTADVAIPGRNPRIASRVGLGDDTPVTDAEIVPEEAEQQRKVSPVEPRMVRLDDVVAALLPVICELETAGAIGPATRLRQHLMTWGYEPPAPTPELTEPTPSVNATPSPPLDYRALLNLSVGLAREVTADQSADDGQIRFSRAIQKAVELMIQTRLARRAISADSKLLDAWQRLPMWVQHRVTDQARKCGAESSLSQLLGEPLPDTAPAQERRQPEPMF